MKTDELLKPRYKVIADYPNSKGNVGDILYQYIFETSETGLYTFVSNLESPLSGYNIKPSDIDKYPHLFRKMDWWEDRGMEEMPKYLKYFDEDGKLEFVLKVERYKSHRDMKMFWSFEYLWDNEPNIKRMSLTGWIPATEQEYNDFTSPSIKPTNHE